MTKVSRDTRNMASVPKQAKATAMIAIINEIRPSGTLIAIIVPSLIPGGVVFVNLSGG